jgi:predicted N-acetyltransferase YhbS
VGDGAKRAWIYDVMVAPSWRGKGLGEALMRLLLDHPAVRHTRGVCLTTRDAQTFYARLGFGDRETLETRKRPWPATEMVLFRSASQAA